MDSSEPKDGVEAGAANSPSRPLRCRVQSPVRRSPMSRSVVNRERDDNSAPGGGAGAAAAYKDPGDRGRGDGAKVLGAFAGPKDDGEEFLREQSFLAAKGCKNDEAECLGTRRKFLAATGCKNDEAEFLGTGQMFLAAKASKNDRTAIENDGAEAEAEAEAEEVPGAFAGSKKANTVNVAAAAERVDGAVLDALAEKATAAFFEAAPTVPHAVNLTDKRRLPSPSLDGASVSRAASHSNTPQCQTLPSQCAHMSEFKPHSSKRVRTSNRSSHQCPSTSMNESKDQKIKELKNIADMQEKTQNELEDDLPGKDTTIATSKGLNASSRKYEAIATPHPLSERARIELVETEKIEDVNFVQKWLLKREKESDENYFQRIATGEEKVEWLRVRDCPNVFGQEFSRRRLTSLKTVSNTKDILFLYQQLQKSGSTLHIREIAPLSMHGLSEVMKFLCRNCLSRNEKADRLGLEILSEAVKDISNAEAIGDVPGFIATIVLRSFIGNAESQRLCLQILVLLARRYQNKLKIIQLGGFSSALWHVSQQHAMLGCKLMASLMDAEEGLMKYIKDGASFELVHFTVKTGHLTPWISAVIERLKDFSFGRTKFIEAVRSLPSKEAFVQQRLTWCLLDFVEEDERYCLQDTLED